MFQLSEDEVRRFSIWLKRHNKTCKFAKKRGTIDGRLTYCFTLTSLGLVTKVKCACGEEGDLTDYKSW